MDIDGGQGLTHEEHDMLEFTDPYTQFVFAHTLAHMAKTEKPPAQHGLTSATFSSITQQAITNPNVMYKIGVIGRDTDDQYVAKEFYFTLQPVDTRINETSQIVEFLPKGNAIYGVWFNHGTSTEPKWGSHT